MSAPSLTVVCLCYNQAQWLRAALDSVVAQTFSPLELIIADDCSTDNSRDVIEEFVIEYPGTTVIFNETNLGNCKAFNKALALASGKYIIDLAADDIMLPLRAQTQIDEFEKAGPDAALCYSNAHFIDTEGKVTGPYYHEARPASLIKQGNVYEALWGPNFICSPSVMFRTSLLKDAGGYDETLAYEDFDVWLRLARKYDFIYADALLTEKRKVPGSLSSKKTALREGKMLASTLQICRKAKALNKNKAEDIALARFAAYHLRLAVITENHEVARGFSDFLREMGMLNFIGKVWQSAADFDLPLGFLRRFIKG
ncbi:MAG: glycosyltransferase [Bacteroidota bacterium]